MAAPTVVTSVKTNVRSDLDTVGITITHGLTLVNGDELVAFLAQGDNIGTSITCTDWTQLFFNVQAGGDDRVLCAMRKIITDAGSEPAAYTFLWATGPIGNANQALVLVQVRGPDTTTPEDVTPTTSSGVDDFTPANVAITTVTNDCLILIAKTCSLPDGAAAGKTAGAPSGWTLVNSETFTTGTDLFEVMLEVASNTQASFGTVTPGNWTSTADDATADWITAAVAIRPAAGGGTDWHAPVYQIGKGRSSIMVPSGFVPPTRIS